jgi:hypothetical protein
VSRLDIQDLELGNQTASVVRRWKGKRKEEKKCRTAIVCDEA